MAAVMILEPPKWYPRAEQSARDRGSDFAVPQRIESTNGLLEATLDLGWLQLHGPSHSTITRAFNGTIPGPTLVVSAGDTLRLHFRNRLTAQPTAADAPERPDISNLHFHGLHGSSALPADDVTLPIGPRGTFTYVIDIPPDHAAGTYWIHPHVHGSTTLQLGSGAAAALIVRDSPGSLPAAVAGARDVMWMVQHVATALQWNVARMSGDETYAVFDKDVATGAMDGASLEGDIGAGGGIVPPAMADETLVNGRVKPKLVLSTGEWTRWRLIYPGQQAHPGSALDLYLAAAAATAGACAPACLSG